GDLEVVADADAVVVDVEVAVVDLLAAEAAEDVEIRVERDRAIDVVAVGVEVAAGSLVAGLQVVVGDAFGGGGGERHRCRQRKGDQGTLHRGKASVSSCFEERTGHGGRGGERTDRGNRIPP